MTGEQNADGKWSEEKMDGEESVRTVDCLRGRLLAERVASRNAKMEAEQLGNKLIELENLLKKEAKSRNRAEKNLKSLLKKLESNNISYDSSESGLLDKSDITSTSSSSTASSKSEDKNSKNSQMKDFPVCSVENIKLPTGFDHLKSNDSQTSISSKSHGTPVTEKNCTSSELDSKQGHHATSTEDVGLPCPALGASHFPEVMDPLCQNLSSRGEVHSGRSSELESNQNYNNANTDDELSVKPSAGKEVNQENDQDQEKNQESNQNEEKNQQNDEDEEYHVDNSMALVPVEKRETKQTIDPEVLDATVKEVLDALKHAREQLQSSMERRRRSVNMIKVG
ncbi:claspin-like [Abeliophyllum distichum]|uniref:Claspin-like n=1 Tax=Abeliophyllum distichum TaxID=126358 RepID=A0ABD1NXD4_9LAMI